MKVIAKALGFTIIVVALVLTLIAALYVTMWFVLAIGVTMLFFGTRSVLQAKEYLLSNS